MATLGERLRSHRAGRFTIDELSRRAGVSSGRISQIERGIANPSFETLWKLASALEVSIGSFFDGDEPESPLVVRKAERKRLVLAHDELDYELLTPNLQGLLEVFIFSVPSGFDNSRRPISHRGEECIHVLEGTLVVNVGNNEFVLEEGDSVTYESTVPHFVRNRSGHRARAIAAITPPSF